jgi:hypothetical protein
VNWACALNWWAAGGARATQETQASELQEIMHHKKTSPTDQKGTDFSETVSRLVIKSVFYLEFF